MSEMRATKSGVALDNQKRMLAKWKDDTAIEALTWVGEKIGEPLACDGSIDSVWEVLNNGIVLSKLANWVKPGSISEKKLAKAPTMPFKKMELINLFLEVMKNEKCVKENDLFQTVDLYEKVNVGQVILTIASLGRKMVEEGRGGYGKAESKGVTKEWTEEQLKAGQGIIGLQMGSNKGASQAGQNFGKSRSIVD